jgi:hypothetical protein
MKQPRACLSSIGTPMPSVSPAQLSQRDNLQLQTRYTINNNHQCFLQKLFSTMHRFSSHTFIQPTRVLTSTAYSRLCSMCSSKVTVQGICFTPQTRSSTESIVSLKTSRYDVFGDIFAAFIARGLTGR